MNILNDQAWVKRDIHSRTMGVTEMGQVVEQTGQQYIHSVTEMERRSTIRAIFIQIWAQMA